MEMRITGGARIGNANASWPFASLSINQDRIALSSPLSGTLTFFPGDIISIESLSGIWIVGNGIKINHRNAKYNQTVIFWTTKTNKIINAIQALGFLSDKHTVVEEPQKNHAPPMNHSSIRWVSIFFLFLFLLAALAFDLARVDWDRKDESPFGIGTKIALVVLGAISYGGYFWNPVRAMFVKGRTDAIMIKRIFIAGFMISGTLLIIIVITKP